MTVDTTSIFLSSYTSFQFAIGLTIPAIYSLISIFAYILLMFVLTKERLLLSNSFYWLFFVQSAVQIVICINAFFCVRLVMFINAFGPAGRIFLHVPTFFCQVIRLQSTWMIRHAPYTQFLFIALISFNRFTILTFPLYHDKFWRNFYIPLILLALFGPFASTWPAFTTVSYYTITTGAGLQLVSAVSTNILIQMVYTMYVVMPATITANLLTFFYVWRMMKIKQSSFEMKLIITSLFNATAMTVAITFVIINVYSRGNYLFALSQMLLPYVCDVMTLNTPYVYFALSSNARKTALKLFFKVDTSLFKTSGQVHNKGNSLTTR